MRDANNNIYLYRDWEDYPLTRRQTQLMLLRFMGYDTREAAERLEMSPHTARNTLEKARKRLEVESITEAFSVMLVNQWLSIDDLSNEMVEYVYESFPYYVAIKLSERNDTDIVEAIDNVE
jgi:DNA-binding CsgD family transcriptional regulator